MEKTFKQSFLGHILVLLCEIICFSPISGGVCETFSFNFLNFLLTSWKVGRPSTYPTNLDQLKTSFGANKHIV